MSNHVLFNRLQRNITLINGTFINTDVAVGECLRLDLEKDKKIYSTH